MFAEQAKDYFVACENEQSGLTISSIIRRLEPDL